jgi:serine/threonine-protein kinase
LAAAHAQGIVHRDLKPDNIFLIRDSDGQDFVKILDFGAAKVASAGAKLTRAGAVVGTPLYMSPEQAAGTAVDARTDIYALGVILYELVSGRVPFDADNIMGILTQHMIKAPTPFRDLDPPRSDVPAELEAVIFKALSKKPEQRYQTMDALALDLDLFVGIGNRRRILFLRSRTKQFVLNAGSQTTQRLKGEAGVNIAYPLVREHQPVRAK